MGKLSFHSVSAVGTFGLAIFELSNDRLGNGLFTIFIAAGLLLHEFAKSPSELHKKLLGFIARISETGARASRVMVIFIAIGGTLLAVDLIYDIDFLPFFHPLDVIIKRLSIPIVIATIVLYTRVILFTFISYIREKYEDGVLRSLELNFYIFSLFYTITCFVFFAGFPVEDVLRHGLSGQQHELPIWRGDERKIMYLTIIILQIWIIATFLLIFSRHSELWLGKTGVILSNFNKNSNRNEK